MENDNFFAMLLNFILELFSSKVAVEVPNSEVKNDIPQPRFTLSRKQFRPDGIFSVLSDKDGNLVANTLEHSYNNLPKIPNGVWKCVRGPHRLHNMTEDFITFEITGIEGHSDLLFHWGNYNKDSEGCVLLGESIAEDGSQEMVTNSRATFAKFMTSLDGVNEFYLLVK